MLSVAIRFALGELFRNSARSETTRSIRSFSDPSFETVSGLGMACLKTLSTPRNLGSEPRREHTSTLSCPNGARETSRMLSRRTVHYQETIPPDSCREL